MLCALAIASFLHGRKLSAKDNDMDRLANGLSGIEAYLRPGTYIQIDNGTQIGEYPFMLRYLLAPAITNIVGANDTVLSIADKNTGLPPDSSRKLLWSNSDTLYQYILTCQR